MKVLVTVKRVIDYNVKIRVKQDNTGVEKENVKMSMNPFDEIAVEEAIRLKEKNIADEILVISIGNDNVQETIRSALAMGADKGIMVKTNQDLEPLSIAKILTHFVNKEKVDLTILGKQAIDDDYNQTGQMLAGLLNYPQATFASKILKEDNHLLVTREVDGGLETLKVNLPCIVTTDLRLNEPRYASLPNIMKAKTKPLDIIDLEALNIDVSNRLELVKVKSPPVRGGSVKMLQDSNQLIDVLKNKEGIL
jgi:electron transfer flavoprotein beta subunit